MEWPSARNLVALISLLKIWQSAITCMQLSGESKGVGRFAARSLELEQREKLDADCNEMQSQLSALEEERSQKRKIQEVVVTEERVRRTVFIKLRSPNARARTKMKARRLILEANSSTESRAAASQERLNPEAETELNKEIVVREKEVPVEKNLWISAVSPTTKVTRRDTRKEQDKAIMTEEVPLGRNQVPSAGIRMRVPLKKPAKVLALSSDNKKDPMALEKVAEKVVEDVVEETAAPQKMVSPRWSYWKRAKSLWRRRYSHKYSMPQTCCVGRTRAKVVATSAAAAKERQLQET
ncbi:hypothetical protein AXG93_4835s1000 [Marchantia polymorpha subsp. ruderalis]|uniref:Uncharacterized protein n=1 Tax=Marchantia polymorpha subsp. ruderalis TaxID=1480154 RepID=A0A176VVK1_MARPO|nr:hypothetical protein AXG93_4835s1000 [Marchantia polymorpha subsp. ruderalis]